ncbi:MAG: tetratricopeptide repeat protein [Phycisphaerae bacterium]|nr:tetratricopeptide repeat protein [Phycisphaerae bacterium]
MNKLLPLWLSALAGWLLIGSAGPLVAQTAEAPTASQPGTLGAPPSIPESLEQASAEIAAAEEAVETGSGEWQIRARKARELASYVLSAEPLNPRAQFVLGRVMLLEGRAREAMDYITKYTQDPREGQFDWLGFKLLGDVLAEGKYYELAESKYLQALQLNRQEPGIFFGLATVRANRKMFKEAADHARQGIALQSPPRAKYHALLARILLETLKDATTDPQTKVKNLSEAQAEARRAVELIRERVREDPAEVNRLGQLSNLLVLQRTVEETRLSLYPEQADIYLAIARIVQDQADLARLTAYHQAIAVLERGIEQTGANAPPELLYEAARLMYAVGRIEDARTALKSLLEKDPTHAEGRALLERLGEPPAP